MEKELTCIECPIGCGLTLEIENCKVLKVSGNKCPKGEPYAVSEIENPTRILTATVKAVRGLPLKMVPVRTDRPIPKNRIFEAMEVIQAAIIEKQAREGEVVIENILGMGANVIVTREA